MADWIENTGTVPDGISSGDMIEVTLRDGKVMVWRERNNILPYWVIMNDKYDITRWRKVE